jgi:hypothetical protein
MHDITQAHCSRCGHSTHHDILGVDHREYEGGTYDLYEMLRCRGCNEVTMRRTSLWIEDEPPFVFYYPPVIARRAPDWMIASSVPAPIRALMRETYTSVENNSRRLVAMGIRAAIENVMIEKVGDQQSFKSLVDAFQKAGYLSVRQAMALDTILEAGHATIHRGWEPTNQDIATLLDIAETIIESAYLHEDRARDLDRKVPKRQRPAKPAQ